MVYIYCDYDGVINPLDLYQNNGNGLQIRKMAQGYYQPNCHKYDLDWSSLLVSDLAQIASLPDVCWLWLTSNQPWMNKIVDSLNASITKAPPLPGEVVAWLDERGHPITPDGKLGIIEQRIRNIHDDQSPRHDAVVWVDDDYAPKPSADGYRLVELANELQVPFLKLTPKPKLG